MLSNHNPIIIPPKCFGDNFVTIDNPIGDKHNSAIVTAKYAKANISNDDNPFSSAKNLK